MASHDPKQVNFKTIPNPKTIEWPDNEHWHDDVPGNLDTFVRLSKAGLYSKANSFYHDLLKPHAANDFAIVAQYAETLIEQGAFKAAEDFLNDDLVSNSTFEGEERTVLQLLSANARMYTRFEWDQAAEVAAKAVRTVGEVLIKENMSPTQLQIQIISLRIIGILLRNGQTDEGLKLVMQTSDRPEPHKDAGWKDIIISLLVANHVWEAHTLFKIYIHYERPQGDAELRQILDAIPTEPDTMYRLVEMSMLIECLRCVELTNDEDNYWRKGLKVALSDGSTMDNTAFPIKDSSAYQALQLFAAKKLKYQNAKSPDQMLRSAMESGNFMFALAISAQYSIPLPGHWIAQTGADIRAITSWHRELWIPRLSPPTGRVLLKVISYPTASESQQVNKTQRDTARALRISVIYPTAGELQTWFGAFKRTMQMVTFTATDIMLINISLVTNVCIRLVGLYGECTKQAINAANCTADNDDILALMWTVIQRITQKTILATVTVILKVSLGAMIGYLGPVDSIWKTIMNDPTNVELFGGFEDDWWTMLTFLLTYSNR